MNKSKPEGDLYRVVKKKGTHLAESKDTPGAVRGTLLSDSNRQLAGQAEFIKVEDNNYDFYTSPTYDGMDKPAELTDEEREMAELLGEFAAALILALVTAAAPHVKRWWQDKAAPGIKRKWREIKDKKVSKRQRSKSVESENQVEVEETLLLIDRTYEEYQNDMTSVEAQKELLDIFILTAITEAKIRRLSNSRVVNEKNPFEYIEGKEIAEKLSSPQFVDSINEILQTNPVLLDEKTPILSFVLGHTLIQDGEFVPIQNEAVREIFALNA